MYMLAQYECMSTFVKRCHLITNSIDQQHVYICIYFGEHRM